LKSRTRLCCDGLCGTFRSSRNTRRDGFEFNVAVEGARASAADPQPIAQKSPEPDALGSTSLRYRCFHGVSQTPPKDCDWNQTVDAAALSPGADPAEISIVVHAPRPSETRAERASKELIAAILEMKHRNPRFGCPRISQEIAHAFGVEIDKDVVRRILARHLRSPSGNEGPSWLTLIGNTKDSLWSVDLFRCESIVLMGYWVMAAMDLFTRRIVGFGVAPTEIDGVAVCRMFNHAILGQPLPKHLSTDNDPLFRFHRWRANLRVLEIKKIKSVPFVPCSHPFVERLIGTVRREYLDHSLFWNRLDLQRKLDRFAAYYNESRVHSRLAGTTPSEHRGRPSPRVADLQQLSWQVHCHGLFHTPIAA
jgi:transposase InsO family protein